MGVTEPFTFRVTKSGQILVSREGRLVATVSGADAARLALLLGIDDATDQELLARATGNYRRGNERTPHRP
jgi:hypothetical protein